MKSREGGGQFAPMKLSRYRPTADSLAGQSLLLAIGRGGAKMLNFLGFLIVARSLGPVAYGGFTFALSLASVLAFIPNMGLDPLYSREVASGRLKASDLLGTVLHLKLLGSGCFLVVYLSLVELSATSAPVRESALPIAVAMILLAFGDTWRTVLIAAGRAGLAGALEVVPAMVFLGMSMAVVRMTPTAESASLSFVSGQIAVGILGSMVVLRLVGKPHVSRAPGTHLQVMKMAAPLMLIWFLSDLYLRIDMTLLYYFRGDGETGFYGASYRLVEGMVSAALVVCSVALPRMAAAWAKGIAEWRRECSRAHQILMLIAVPAAVILTAFPKQITLLLYGSKFAESAQSLRILGPATLLLGLGFVYASALTSIGLVWVQFRITVVALIVNVLLNCLWIPRFAGPGAALATLVAALAYVMMAHIVIRRRLLTMSAINPHETLSASEL